MDWILNDEKMVKGLMKFHKKWGSRRAILLKVRIYLNKKKIGSSKQNSSS